MSTTFGALGALAKVVVVLQFAGVTLLPDPETYIRLGVIRGQADEAGRAAMQVVTQVRCTTLDVAMSEAGDFERALLATPGWQAVAEDES
jgi:hypothetical protein